VNNLHIITLYNLHNKLSCESRLSRSFCRTCRVVCRDVTSKWNLGLCSRHVRLRHIVAYTVSPTARATATSKLITAMTKATAHDGSQVCRAHITWHWSLNPIDAATALLTCAINHISFVYCCSCLNIEFDTVHTVC